MTPKSPTLLLVEDSPDDVFFFRHALKKSGLNVSVQVVSNGQRALDYFAGVGRYSDRDSFPLPAIVFLDLKMPLLGGFDVLAWMKQQPGLSKIPVIILTGSSEQRDKARACELGAQDYCVKPLVSDKLRDLVVLLPSAAVSQASPGCRELSPSPVGTT